MVIEIDKQIWRTPPLGKRESSGFVRPDWHGLQARLRTAREVGRAIIEAPGPSGRADGAGSFDETTAQALISFGYGSAFVNPDASANRNPVGVKDVPVAGVIRSGDRG